MIRQDAIKVINELIRGAMAHGLFKNFSDLDTARAALQVLSAPAVKEEEKGKS